VDIAQDPVAGANDGRGFTVHEKTEGVAIAGQDSIDRGAFIVSRADGGWS
jgi:hypothetical protein